MTDSDGGSLRRGLDTVRAPEGPMPLDTFLEHQPRFEPRKSEAALIARMQEAIESRVGSHFAEVQRVIDSITAAATTEEGTDYSSLTPENLERAILGLQMALAPLEQMRTELHLTTQLAYTTWDEAYYEAYSSAGSGTIEDKTARARRKSRDERFYYLWAYWFWKTVGDRVETAQSFRRILDFQVSRRYRRQQNGKSSGSFQYD